LRERFRFRLPVQELLDTLTAFYCIEVEKRHGKMQLDSNVKTALTRTAQFLCQENPKFGLMLCGTCGNGKTTMVYALQKTINHFNNMKHFSFLDEYFNVGLEIVDVRNILQVANNENKFNNLRTRDMLAIDDMGKEPTEIMNYGNVLNPVIDIIEYRYQHQLFTVMTTNLTPTEIRTKYGTRIADRFNEMLEVIVFQDISYRR